MKRQYEKIFPDKLAERTVVIVPSLTLDTEILSKVKGAVHYEERLLCMLMLLRMPLTKLIYSYKCSGTRSDRGLLFEFVAGNHRAPRKKEINPAQLF
jgi:hypothetical protein